MRSICNICGKLHDESVHKEHQEWSCLLCGKRLANKKSLQKHTYELHNDKVHQCDLCSYTTKSNRSFARHQAIKHNKSYLLQLNKVHKCKECDFSVGGLEELSVHEFKTHGIQIPCKSCDFLGSSKNRLAYHVKTHHMNQPKKTASKSVRIFNSAVIYDTRMECRYY